jgi:hypothetical protein
MTTDEKRAWKLEWNARNVERRKAYKAKYLAKPESREKARQYQRRRRQNNLTKFMVDLHKAAPCVDCGERYPAQVMEFDHRDSAVKVADVATLARRSQPSIAFDEISKCDLVCANCHRIRTIYRRFK